MEQQQPHTGDAVNVGAAAQMRMRHAETGNRDRKPVDLHDMIAVTTRLAQILAEEVDCLDEMRISDIEELQDEKRKLSRTLELMKREVERRPDIKRSFQPEDIAVFHQVSEIFEEVLQENHRKLLIAKEINFRVVQAISDVVCEENVRTGYNRRGKAGEARDGAPSISLNKTI